MFLSRLGIGAPLTAIVLLLSADQASAGSEIGHSARDPGAGSSWSDFACLDEHKQYSDFFYPSDTWKDLKLDDAWKDVVRNCKDTDRPSGLAFTESLLQTLKLPWIAGCSNFGKLDSCIGTIDCSSTFHDLNSSGLAATKIWNALTVIGEMHTDYPTSIRSAILFGATSLEPFGRIPQEPSTWLSLLINIAAVGASLNGRALYQQFPRSRGNGPTLHNINDTALALMGQAPTIALRIMTNTDKYDWAPAKGIKFEDYIRRQTLDAWTNVTSVALQTLFNGDDASIERLWRIIKDGQLTYGRADRSRPSASESDIDRAETDSWGKAYFVLMIPTVWRQSGTHAFAMESGAPCDSSQSLKKYLDNGTINATGICYEDKQYFLVQPAGSSTKGTFSAPVGLDMLNQGHWDGITRDTLITGSLRTYAANGNQNGGVINLKERNTLLDLFYGDITTPGFMRLPVCTSEQALQPWRGRKPKSNLYYPCAVSDKNK